MRFKWAVQEFFELDAANGWRLSPSAALLLFAVAPVVVFSLFVLAVVDRSFFWQFTNEDSVVEWLQFAGFAGASFVSLLVAKQLRATGRHLPAFFYLMLAMGAFFIAGEEISWGQRLLGIETPVALGEVNKQDETTLHNISGIDVIFVAGMWLVGLYGTIGPWIARKLRSSGRLKFPELLVPPFCLTSAFLLVLAWRVLRPTVLGQLPVSRFGEALELVLAFGLATFAVLAWRRVAAESRVTELSALPTSVSSASGRQTR